MYFLMLCFFLFFMVGVASNPSPYFGGVSLALASVFGAGVMVGLSSTFVSLVLMLVYLGGMLVVFIYSVAMSSDMYPEAWGNRSVFLYVIGFLGYLFCLWWYIGEKWFFDVGVAGSVVLLNSVAVDLGGVMLLYSFGGGCFLILGVVLLLTLFVVLDLVCGWRFGALVDC
uniref:NADH-ubiquinone oxidoreductase chain 6 n=1 Tax=Chamaeleo africanus TaxID=91906 RepID=B7S6H8_CHAAF|nr:NADH dehydrogenase subunit 6 [Chamaeleo africanus]ABM89758.1 NADH dehydrogenase subunit 6 [Chamaeleo africanus]ABM89771.1 NADH dehydrogenase subunit 6 [Chamaeleo africanus]